MKVLVVEDDAEAGAYIKNGLEEHGLVVDLAVNGRDGLFVATSEAYDVIIVDRMLPGIDGISLVRAVRGARIATPVLFLTTMSGVRARVEGLEAGGDEPFAFVELMARLRALARRPPLTQTDSILRVADLETDLLAGKVRRASQEIELQPREFACLISGISWTSSSPSAGIRTREGQFLVICVASGRPSSSVVWTAA